MSITKEFYGRLSDGRDVYRYTLVNKSGMFEEIGKSGRSIPGGSTVEKIEGIAKGYMEKDPSMDYDTAVMKAWENNPELMDAYDSEY